MLDTKPRPEKVDEKLALIGGQWVRAVEGETLPVIDPSTGKSYATVQRCKAEDVNLAIRGARAATFAWQRVQPLERGRILRKVATLLRDNIVELTEIEALDTGKPRAQAAFDIEVAIRYFDYYAGLGGKIDGYTIPFDSNHQAFTIREPHGVTAHVLPWNYPAQMFARDVAPALVMGNAVVVKPAEEACQSAIRMAELCLDAGVHPGALSIVTGLGEEAGAALTSHPGIDHISFTGSPEVGTIIQATAARNNVGCTMELGGKSPQIVFADADLERAVPAIVASIVNSAGQTCSAGSRLLVEASAYDRIVTKVADAFSGVRAGVWHKNLQCGPLINDIQQKRVQRFIDAARSDNIPLIASGRIDEEADPAGYFVTPSLFGPVPESNSLAHEEVFGPVLSVQPFEDESDAIRIANSTEYGLVAYIWTRDGGRQLRLAKNVQCGQVFVNGPGAFGNVELPFGGVKKSGYGREKGLAAIEEYSVLKTILIHHG